MVRQQAVVHDLDGFCEPGRPVALESGQLGVDAEAVFRLPAGEAEADEAIH